MFARKPDNKGVSSEGVTRKLNTDQVGQNNEATLPVAPSCDLIAQIKSKILAAHSIGTPDALNEVESSLQCCFENFSDDFSPQSATLTALLEAATLYIKATNSEEQLGSVLAIAQRTLQNGVVNLPKFTPLRSRWLEFIDSSLQLECMELAPAFSDKDDFRLMAISSALTIAQRLLTLDKTERKFDLRDLSFTVSESCRGIASHLNRITQTDEVSNLEWLIIYQLGEISSLLQDTTLERPLAQLFDRVKDFAGFEEEFLPFEEDEDEPEFWGALGITYKEEDDSDLEDEEDDLDEYEDDEWVEVVEEPTEDERKVIPDAHLNAVSIAIITSPDSEFAMQSVLRGLAKCQETIGDRNEQEPIWRCALSHFEVTDATWFAGLLGMWIANEEEARKIVCNLIIRVFGGSQDLDDDEPRQKDLSDQGDTIALLVELVGRHRNAAYGIEEVLKELPYETRKLIEGAFREALDDGSIFFEWLDIGLTSQESFERELSRIFCMREG